MRRDLAPADAGLADVCATQLRSLREYDRSLLASRIIGQPAQPAVTATNGAMTRAPPPHHRGRRAPWPSPPPTPPA
ncbi:hypothetical protein ABZ135_22985 [Streptomyces sp. NPDC006339]|uniref:hypothetical protein n=1 Tax=Streptomyces sp. NPDC006339 TaxID=3156755 RepID=UPI0033A45B2D